jgi:hypothetical protein
MAEGQKGAQPARARPQLARRSEPLPASTVLAFRNIDGRRSGNTIVILLVGFERACCIERQTQLGCLEGRMGIPKGKETVGFVPLGPLGQQGR